MQLLEELVAINPGSNPLSINPHWNRRQKHRKIHKTQSDKHVLNPRPYNPIIHHLRTDVRDGTLESRDRDHQFRRQGLVRIDRITHGLEICRHLKANAQHAESDDGGNPSHTRGGSKDGTTGNGEKGSRNDSGKTVFRFSYTAVPSGEVKGDGV
jgi:hypothetical protein